MDNQVSNIFSTIPSEVYNHFLQFCDLKSVMQLVRTSKFFGSSISLVIKNPHSYINELCNRVLRASDMGIVNQYFTVAELGKAPVCITWHNWKELPGALKTMQQAVSIQALEFGSESKAEMVDQCLSVCPDVKKVTFQSSYSLKIEQIPDKCFTGLEKIELMDTCFESAWEQYLSEFVNTSQKLRSLILHNCQNFYPDFYNFNKEASNRLEFFSETTWAGEPNDDYSNFRNWKEYVGSEGAVALDLFEKLGKTNAISCYFFACREEDEDKKMELLKQSLVHNPKFINAQVMVGTLLAAKDPLSQQEAKKYFDHSIATVPEFVTPYIGLIRILLTDPEAIEERRRLLETATLLATRQTDTDALTELAEIYTQEFDDPSKNKAQQALDRIALSNQPDSDMDI
jgi:hypothetical protein